MYIFYFIGLIVMAIVSLTLSILGFMGKDMILDDTYIKASKEEREKMDKKAYRLQGAIIFLFLFFITMCNILRVVLQMASFTYAVFVIAAIGIAYAIISHYKLKKNNDSKPSDI